MITPHERTARRNRMGSHWENPIKNERGKFRINVADFMHHVFDKWEHNGLLGSKFRAVG